MTERRLILPIEQRQLLDRILQSVDERRTIHVNGHLGYIDRVWLTLNGEPRVDIVVQDGTMQTIEVRNMKDVRLGDPIVKDPRAPEEIDLGAVAREAGYQYLVHQTRGDLSKIFGFGALYPVRGLGASGVYVLGHTSDAFRKTSLPWGNVTLLLDPAVLTAAHYQIGMDVREHGAFGEGTVRGFDRQGIARLLRENNYFPDGKFYFPVSTRYIRHVVVDADKVEEARKELKAIGVIPPTGMSWEDFVQAYR